MFELPGAVAEKKPDFVNHCCRVTRTETVDASALFDSPNQEYFFEKYKSRLTGDFHSLMMEGSDKGAKPQREGMAALEAWLGAGIIAGPITRGEPGGIDFYDKYGRPFDVKTPKSGHDMGGAAKSILHELNTVQTDRAGDAEYDGHIVLDTTFLKDSDRNTLWAHVNTAIDKEKDPAKIASSKRRIIEVHLPLSKEVESVFSYEKHAM